MRLEGKKSKARVGILSQTVLIMLFYDCSSRYFKINIVLQVAPVQFDLLGMTFLRKCQYWVIKPSIMYNSSK